MSLGASLRRFQRFLHPVIVVDGSHLKGRFGGTMFVATAQDRNEQVYLIAFGYGDLENNLSWEWFLDCLKGSLGHIDDLDVAVIINKAARAYIELGYNWHMEELRNLHPNAYDYVIDVGPYKWSYVHCPNRRYKVITTNAAE
ncbi:hypothetical protein Ddye_005156 [Dipteronia dyeriana]|uniref:MULE transposase domain-containing protein n=1 Tax=Dipteronia dyeriana TaxID=168575 RepID=A0AAD9XFW3_9ROSI|nr:hypothetical protein Ddye_005156 [Dipteronia dyeriana]